jgi:hypothetical protein
MFLSSSGLFFSMVAMFDLEEFVCHFRFCREMGWFY